MPSGPLFILRADYHLLALLCRVLMSYSCRWPKKSKARTRLMSISSEQNRTYRLLSFIILIRLLTDEDTKWQKSATIVLSLHCITCWFCWFSIDTFIQIIASQQETGQNANDTINILYFCTCIQETYYIIFYFIVFKK
jgi:hypothetical protein